MTQWLFFSLLAPFLWSVSLIFDQIVRKNYLKEDIAFTFLVGIARTIVGIGLMIAVGFPQASLKDVLLIFICGTLWIYPVILHLKAVSIEEPSRIMIFYQAISIFTLLLANMFLGETLSAKQILAFLIILAGGAIASIKIKHKKIRFSKAALLIVFASLLFASSDVLFKHIQSSFGSFANAFAYFLIGTGIASFSLFLIPGQIKKIPRAIKSLNSHTWILIFGSVGSGIIALASFLYALTLGKVALTSVIAATTPIFTILINLIASKISRQVEKEEYNFQAISIKTTSIGLILIGLYFLH